MKPQNDRLLSYLKANKRIDSDQARKELGIARLAARIHDLRGKGHKLESVPKHVRNRYGESVTISEYHLG
jgi:hypothetical protein